MNVMSPEERALRAATVNWCRSIVESEGHLSASRTIGYSLSVLSSICHGRHLPSLGVILALHKHYGEKHSPPAEVLTIVKRESASSKDKAKAAAMDEAISIARAVLPEPSAPESLASTLARVERKITAGTASSREAAQRVVDRARKYASVVEQAHSHKLLVFLGEATGDGPSIQNAALELYDALLGVPELGALLAQPTRPTPAPRREPPPAPPTVDPPREPEPAPEPDDSASYDVVVTRKQAPAESSAPTEPALEYPALAKASQRNPLLIVGGVSIPEVRQKLGDLGINHEWIETRGTVGQTRVEAVTNRIRRTGACAVMVLHGTVGHGTFDRVRSATRLGVVPFIAPRAAGTAELVRSLHALDRQIASGVTQTN